MKWHAASALVAAICAAFALTHSLLATDRAKSLAGKLFGRTPVRAFYRLGYSAIAAATTFLAVYLILRIPDAEILRLPLWARALFHAVQAGGVAIGLLAFKDVRMDEFLGVAQAARRLSKKFGVGDAEGVTQRLVTTGVYGAVRHPLFLAGMLVFTFNPYITRNWLTVTVLADIYFVVGAFIEERRLLARFGDEYRRYMARVPRFVPRVGR